MIIRLIIKVIDGNAISIISKGNYLPTDYVSESNPDLNFTINNIAKEYNIHSSYIDPKLISLGVGDAFKFDGHNIKSVIAYYTIMSPKEFLNEETSSKLCNNFEKFSEQDRVAIRQAISISPY